MKTIFPAPLIAIAIAAVALIASSARADDAPQVVDFNSVKQIVDLVPKKSMMKLKIFTQMESGKTEVNSVLAQNALGKEASWKIKVVMWEPWDAPGEVPSKFRIKAADQIMNVGGTSFGVRMWIYLPADAEAAVKKLSKGSEITIRGHLLRVDFTTNKEEGLKLNFDISRTKIEPS